MAHIEAVRLALLGPGLLTVNLNATTADDPPARGAAAAPLVLRPEGLSRGRPQAQDAHAVDAAAARAREVFVGEGDAALAEVFDDHALIAALGLRAVVNVPLLEDGRCAATFNVLGTRARWAPGEIALVKLLALVATPWVLRARSAA
jgi:GAF domain-containing protein